MKIDINAVIPFEVFPAPEGDPARCGRLGLEKAEVQTPCFMPVGTRGAVKTLDANDLKNLGADIVLANTYHLMLRPGADHIAEAGGLGKFMGWDENILTDSGGFQIMSLDAKVSEDGAEFTSVYDGSRVSLTPEEAVRVQNQIGSDIQMALDVCPQLPAPETELKDAMRLTTLWAERARAEFLKTSEQGWQFGIVQGGDSEKLRQESARQITDIGFDGYALGGLSVGEDRERRLPAIAAACEILPDNQPRYLMGVGDPLSLIEAISCGIDMFDCVLPTRLARHGTALTSEGKLNLKNSRFTKDDSPIDPAFEGGTAFPSSPVPDCSRAYLRHLLMVKEPTAARILTLHNLAWLLHLMQRARDAISAGTLPALLAEIKSVWE